MEIQKLRSERRPFYFFKEFSRKFGISFCEMVTKTICELLTFAKNSINLFIPPIKNFPLTQRGKVFNSYG